LSDFTCTLVCTRACTYARIYTHIRRHDKIINFVNFDFDYLHSKYFKHKMFVKKY